MSHSIIKADIYKRSASTLLSAVFLLTSTLLTPAFATSNDIAQMTNVKNDTYHCTDSQALSHRSKNQRTMTCMLTQLQDYQQKNMTARQQYFAYKAQAWLNYAIHKESMNSRSSTSLYAAKNAETILVALKNGTEQDLTLIQDIPSDSALMRPDLWATLSALKDSNCIESAAREIAFSEVALIWAATNQCERGRYESGIHFRMADRWLEQAREAYVNAHDSQTNVNLEQLIVRYYEQYAPLSASDDVCHGQVLMPNH